MIPLRALLVDVGGTLVDDATWMPADRFRQLQLKRLAAALGEERPWFVDFVDHAFEAGVANSYEQRTAEVVSTFLVERGVTPTEAEVEAICHASAPPMHEVVELEPYAHEAMESARRLGLRMAICSNTLWRDDADARRDWNALGFGDCFDAYVTSRSTRFEKPHPAIFERCLEALAVTPAETAMLGDRPELDILGARGLGMRSIWKRPPSFVGPPDPSPDAEISSLRDLPPILESWTRDSGR